MTPERMNCNTQATKHLIEAKRLIEEAKMELIRAEQALPYHRDKLKLDIKEMYMFLYSDSVHEPKGGDGKWFNLPALLGEVWKEEKQ